MKFIYVAIVLALFGCKPEGDPSPDMNAGNDILVSIEHLANDSAIVFREKVYTLEAGTEIYISRLAYILSKFYLVNDQDERVELENQYALIDAKRGETQFTLEDIPQGDYKAFGFSLGLDSIINHSDPNTYPVDHPLSSVNNALHWDWTSGYIFIGIEGKLANDSANYVYHVAGDNNRIDYEFAFDFKKSEQKLKAELSFIFDEIFKNPVTFDMVKDGMTIHEEYGPVSDVLVQNMVNMFKINSIE